MKNNIFFSNFQYQQSHGGKCGICGDPWMGPKPHEVPGKYANGIIVETYEAEQEVQVTVQITANHKGYFEFKLCPVNAKTKLATSHGDKFWGIFGFSL